MDNDLVWLRSVAEGCMQDVCVIGTPTQATGMEPGKTGWTWGNIPITCGVTAFPGTETNDGSGAPVKDVLVRFPWNTQINGGQRIRLTSRMSDPDPLATPEDYALVGEPVRGVTCLLVRCRRVVGESVK